MSKIRMQFRSAPGPGDLTTREAAIAPSAPQTLDEGSRSVQIIAATEEPARVWDWDRYEIVDEVLLMDGVQTPDQVPLLDAHSRYNTASVLGSVRGFSPEGSQLIADAYFSSTAEDSLTLVREGHLTDVSVGYRVLEAVWIAEDERSTVNGREFEGPLRVATSWVLREVSLVPIGADEYAKIRAAARQTKTEVIAMDERLRQLLIARGLISPDDSEARAWEAYRALEPQALNQITQELTRQAQPEPPAPAPVSPAAAPAPAPAPATGADPDAAARAAAAAERQRISEIQAMGQRFNVDAETVQGLVNDGVSLETARSRISDLFLERLAAQPAPGAAVRHGADEADKYRGAVEDGLMLRAGINLEKPRPGADEFRTYTLRELCREALRRNGHHIPTSPRQMVERAMSTSDLPMLLGNVANKKLLEAFDTQEETWQDWCGEDTADDFKQQTRVRDSELDGLLEVKEEGEYKYGGLAEGYEQWQLSKFGRIFPFSWESMVNDDLGALTGFMERRGRAAARLVGDTAYAVVTANGAMGDGIALFDSDHSNLAGTGAAIGTTTLGAGFTAMRGQTDENSVGLNIRPIFLLAPTALEISTEEFFNTIQFMAGTSNGMKNIFTGSKYRLERVYEGRLDSDSATAWYLAAAKGRTVKVAFLTGERKPAMEYQVGFKVDGIEYKVRQVVAAYASDWRGLYKNAGT